MKRAHSTKCLIYRELIAAIGEEATLSLLAAFGGTRQYVPSRAPRPTNPIRKIIGANAMEALMAEFGGLHVTLPKPSLRDLVARETGPANQVALRLRTTERYVRRIRQQLAADQKCSR